MVIQNYEVDRNGLDFNIRFTESFMNSLEAKQITGYG